MKTTPVEHVPAKHAFTLLECLAVATVLALLLITMLPALTRTSPGSRAFQCLNNLRQLTAAWRQQAGENSDNSLASRVYADYPRAAWMTGTLNYDGTSASNYDPAVDIAKSRLYLYMGGAASSFRCPADQSTVILAGSWNGLPAGSRVLRVRSYSMSPVFDQGEWLDGVPTAPSQYWRTYARLGQIVIPSKTIVFADANPAKTNDGSFKIACTYNQPGDPPTSAMFIDLPANVHQSAGVITFADGHAEIHAWRSGFLRNLATSDGYLLAGNRTLFSTEGIITAATVFTDPVTFADDAHWLAERATVPK